MSLGWENVIPAMIGFAGSGIWAAFAQRSQRRLERERQFSQSALAALQAQLTFDAEVRRQSAAKKVDALVKISAAIQSAVAAVYPLSVEDPVAQRRAGEELWTTVRPLLVFVRPQLFEAIKLFSAELQRYVTARQIASDRSPDIVALHEAGESARNAAFDLIERELHLKDQGALVNR